MKGWQAQGLWWLPETPGKRVFGTLTCDNEGELRLSLLGSFTGGALTDLGNALLGTPRQFAAILGVATKEGTDKEITLRDCFVSRQSYSSGELGAKQEFIAHRAFVGAHFPSDADLGFQSATLAFSGLAPWADGLTGFSSDGRPMSAVWKHPTPISGQIPGGTFHLGVAGRSSMEARKRTLTEEVGLEFSFSPAMEQRSLEQKIVYPLQNFFTLATDTPNAITRFHVSRDTGRLDQVAVVGPTTYPDPSTADRLMPFEMLFSLGDVRSRLERVFQRWFEISKRFEGALVVYFGGMYRPAGYTEIRFQQIMQVVDLFHSAGGSEASEGTTPVGQFLSDVLHDLPQAQSGQLRRLVNSHPLLAAERALAASLEQHRNEMAPLVTDKEGRGADDFLKYVINTLAYTITRERPAGGFAATGADLHWLAERMAFVVKISLLKELEFTDEDVAGILKRNRQFRHIADSIQPTTSWL